MIRVRFTGPCDPIHLLAAAIRTKHPSCRITLQDDSDAVTARVDTTFSDDVCLTLFGVVNGQAPVLADPLHQPLSDRSETLKNWRKNR